MGLPQFHSVTYVELTIKSAQVRYKFDIVSSSRFLM